MIVAWIKACRCYKVCKSKVSALYTNVCNQKCEVYLGHTLPEAADYCKMQRKWWSLPRLSLFWIKVWLKTLCVLTGSCMHPWKTHWPDLTLCWVSLKQGFWPYERVIKNSSGYHGECIVNNKLVLMYLGSTLDQSFQIMKLLREQGVYVKLNKALIWTHCFTERLKRFLLLPLLP